MKQKRYHIVKGENGMKYIGCSGWSYKYWEGVFYPDDLSPQKYLSYYANYFRTVEVNNTFYRFPTEEAVFSWAKLVPKEFRFSLKVSRYVTHVKRMKQAQEPLRRFYGLQEDLQDKMGCFLFQFPETFKFTEENLERLLSQLDPAYKNVVEFRHYSWWALKIIKTLQEANIAFCSVSGLGLPEDLIVTKGCAYIRFHGDPAYASCYTDQEISHWADKIKGAGVKELWAYFNNDAHAYAVQNAKRLEQLLHGF